MRVGIDDWDEAYRDEARPPWEIGRPQPRFEALARSGVLRGRVLDCGCGTGEHALLAAELGAAEVVGIDLSARAIARAEQKAAERELPVRFAVGDALEMPAPDERFDAVVDSGVFHSFDDLDRRRYVAALRRVLRVDGVCYLMSFSDRQPGDWGPRRVREDELRDAFADHWVAEITPATFIVNPIEGVTEVEAWFATMRRTS